MDFLNLWIAKPWTPMAYADHLISENNLMMVFHSDINNNEWDMSV